MANNYTKHLDKQLEIYNDRKIGKQKRKIVISRQEQIFINIQMVR